jgi:hypothetical protein
MVDTTLPKQSVSPAAVHPAEGFGAEVAKVACEPWKRSQKAVRKSEATTG